MYIYIYISYQPNTGVQAGQQAGLYVSTDTTPTRDTHTWSASSVTGDSVLVPPTHPSYKPWFFLVVYGLSASSSFSLTAEEVEPEPEQVGQTVGRVEASADTKQCGNCMAMIPSARFMIHEATCARNNWRCPTCKQILRPSARKRHAHCPHCSLGLDADDVETHIAVVHRDATCECGARMQVHMLQTHRKTK